MKRPKRLTKKQSDEWLAEIEMTGRDFEIERLQKENQQLKSEHNKVAVEYLNKLFDRMTWNGWGGDTQINALQLYNTMVDLIKELKGESDD
jgi:hypothetical protein